MENLMIQAFHQNHPDTAQGFFDQLKKSLGGDCELLELHKRMTFKYGPPKLGTGRATYLSKSVVFKVPITPEGCRANDIEGSTISIGEPGEAWHIPIARSKLIDVVDIPVVVMERVVEASLEDIKRSHGQIPNFVSAVDMGQVGYTKRNALVAFDYAN